jgi:hypothetical protein
MNPGFLFSGSDVSGRDLLYSRSVGRKLEGVIARTVTAIAITAAAFAVTPTTTIQSASSTAAVKLDVSDTLLERVWKVRSDGVQPNDKARRYASAVLGAFRDFGFEPDRVVADRDGGIALYVFGRGKLAGGSSARHARVLAANEGELIAMCVDNERNQHDGWEAELGDLDPTVQKIQSFVAS